MWASLGLERFLLRAMLSQSIRLLELRQDSGLYVQQWPTTFGSDLAGEAIELSKGVADISESRRILAHALSFKTGKSENSGFHNFAAVPASATSPLLDSITYEASSVIHLALSTAADGVYQRGFLAPWYPSISTEKLGTTILIRGGSSSMGRSAK